MIAIPVSSTLHTLEAVEYPEDASELSTVSLMCVLSEVADECYRQDQKWGGPEHDDMHQFSEWCDFLGGLLIELKATADDATARRHLVEIAALSVAAIQSMDRSKAGATEPAPALSQDELEFLRSAACEDERYLVTRSAATKAANLAAKGLIHWRENRTPGSPIRGYVSITAAGLAAIQRVKTEG